MSDAVDVRHRIDGPVDGRPLLTINSLGADLAMWEPQVGALSVGRRLILFVCGWFWV